MTGPGLVISPAPNANGDLHLGHLAGPFLAADVFTRYARATGREVLFGTGVQDTQSYVVPKARRLGVPPAALVTRSTQEIEATLAGMGIAVDGFTGVEERFTKAVLEFLERLHAAGRLRLRTVRFPYRPGSGAHQDPARRGPARPRGTARVQPARPGPHRPLPPPRPGPRLRAPPRHRGASGGRPAPGRVSAVRLTPAHIGLPRVCIGAASGQHPPPM